MIKRPDRRSRILGCMLGGAVGDAMGAPVEFMTLEEICRRFGKTGVTGFEKAYGRRGAFTDDTQMTMFTAEGLILSAVRREYTEENMVIPAIYHAYLRWLYTQETEKQEQLISHHGSCSVVDGILTGFKNLYSRRSPDSTCLHALRSGQMGTMNNPLNNSKGCGGIIRVAPIGLAFSKPETAFRRGCESAAITHGHPSGYLAAGFLSALLSMLLTGKSLDEAIQRTSSLLKANKNSKECLLAVEKAVELSQRRNLSPEEIESLGDGRVAEEALAIGICCALFAGNDFRKGVLLSVNHSGDSDATGSITGSIIWVSLHGKESIPKPWLSNLEMREVVEENQMLQTSSRIVVTPARCKSRRDSEPRRQGCRRLYCNPLATPDLASSGGKKNEHSFCPGLHIW
jgi:ADP-ribosyl-[dinitrogen reductase] hydrolase